LKDITEEDSLTVELETIVPLPPCIFDINQVDAFNHWHASSAPIGTDSPSSRLCLSFVGATSEEEAEESFVSMMLTDNL
jgi:hypothetical protein